MVAKPKPSKGLKEPSRKPQEPRWKKIPKDLSKRLNELRKDFKDAGKKLTVHQEPRSEFSAELRSLMDQPRKKISKSPHKDKKKSKYADVFKSTKAFKGGLMVKPKAAKRGY